jgi:hypothetical protein
MAAKFVENLLSTRYINGTLADLSWKYQGLVDLSQRGTGKDGNIESRRKLAEIQLHLARANSLFQARQFQRALDEYKVTQGLVFGLIQPSFNPDLSLHPKLNLPMQASVFAPMLKTSLAMVAEIAPNSVWSSLGGSTVTLPAEVKKKTKPFTNLGVSVLVTVDETVREAGFLGVDAAGRGEWAQAELFFTLGLKALGDPATKEAQIAEASLQMNLGVVALQAGKVGDAHPLLERATEGFQRAGDQVGQAQAAMNLAATFAKEGHAAEAQALLRTAEALLTQAEGQPPSEAPAAPSGAIDTLRNLNINMSTALGASMLDGSRPTTNPKVLADVPALGGKATTFRLPNSADGWTVQDLESNIENLHKVSTKQLSLNTGDGLFTVEWKTGDQIKLADVTALYEQRVASTDLTFVGFRYDLDSDFAVRLPQLYFFTLPVAIGDCHHELGAFAEAVAQYTQAAGYKFVNTAIEVPALWIRLAQTFLAWGDSHYRDGEVQSALDTYSKVLTPDGQAPAGSVLYAGALAPYGDQVKELIDDIGGAQSSTLNPKTVSIVLDVRNKLRMIAAGLDFFGFHANHFPIFKFDYLQSVATYFAQQAVQSEREFINFTARGEDEQLTSEQLTQAVEIGRAQVDLADKQLEQAQAELEVTRENADLASLRVQNAEEHREEYEDVAYELTALEAASVFASGPEGYAVSYTYYSPSEGRNVTLSGSAAYKVMEDAAWRRGMLSRKLELDSLDRNIAELEQNRELAEAQHQAAEARVDVAEQQRAIAEMNQRHAEELLDSFESQLFTPEVWFQLGRHMKAISAEYLARAIGAARRMQQAYELETGFRLTTIKGSYATNIVSGLLSADYLLRDIDYFTVHRINNTKSKDIPIRHQLSLAALNPIGFETTFKATGQLEFETHLDDLDRMYPGAYLRKIKKVVVAVEGLLPPGGVHGTLKNSGISRDRKRDGTLFFRVQPRETLFLSQYDPRADLAIFQPDPKVLDVFEHCGVATGWTLELPLDANDLNYQTISDVKLLIYCTAQHSEELEAQIKATLPDTGESGTSIPFRLLFPDAFFTFMDTGVLAFELRDSDFAFNQTGLTVQSVAVLVVTYAGTSNEGISILIDQGGDSATATTDDQGMVRSDPEVAGNPLNDLIGNPVSAPWTITISDADNPDLDRTQVRDLFLFLEYGFTYRS